MVITVGHSCSMGTTVKQQTSWHGTIETSFFHCVSYRNKKYHICGHSLDTWEYRIYCSPVWGVSVYVCDLRINFDWFLISGNIVTVYMSRWFSSWVRKCKNYDNVVQRTWDMATRSFVTSNTRLHEWNKRINSHSLRKTRTRRQNKWFKEPTSCSRKRDMQDTTYWVSCVLHYLGLYCYCGGMHASNVLTKWGSTWQK
jgi:hypothetical protein